MISLANYHIRPKFILEHGSDQTLKPAMISTSLSRVSTLTRDTDVAILSVCPSVRLSVSDVPVLDESGLTYCHTFSHRTVAQSL